VEIGSAFRSDRITSWGVVHDCFAVHPSKIGSVRGAYLLAFRRVFRSDWLTKLWEQLEDQLNGELDRPPDHAAKLPTSFASGAAGTAIKS
jgi:hypothetical protein